MYVCVRCVCVSMCRCVLCSVCVCVCDVKITYQL